MSRFLWFTVYIIPIFTLVC